MTRAGKNYTKPVRSAGALALKRTGLTLPRIAKRLGMDSDRTVGHWRVGRRKPEQSSRIQMHGEFGIPVEYWDLPESAAKRDGGVWVLPGGTTPAATKRASAAPKRTSAGPDTTALIEQRLNLAAPLWKGPAKSAAAGTRLDPLEVAVADLLDQVDQATSPAQRQSCLERAIEVTGGIAEILSEDKGMASAVKRLRQICDALTQIAADEPGASQAKPTKPSRGQRGRAKSAK